MQVTTPSDHEIAMTRVFDAPRHLVFDPWYPGEAVVTNVLTEQVGKTTLTMTIYHQSKEVRDAALKSGMTRGVDMSFDRLADLVESGRQAGLPAPLRYLTSSMGISSGGPPVYILAESKKPATYRWKRISCLVLFSQNQPWMPVDGAMKLP